MLSSVGSPSTATTSAVFVKTRPRVTGPVPGTITLVLPQVLSPGFSQSTVAVSTCAAGFTPQSLTRDQSASSGLSSSTSSG